MAALELVGLRGASSLVNGAALLRAERADWERDLGGEDAVRLVQSAADDLLAFTRATKPDYEVRPIHRLIAEALMRVERGEIKKLLIQVQPRIGKTEIATIRFAGWWLGRHPDHRLILGSANADLAVTFGRQIRNLAESGTYQGIFPGVRPARDSRAVNNWDLEAPHRGGMLSAGVGGSIVGRGGNVVFIDDPVRSRADAESPTVREKVWRWYNDDLLTRVMNEHVPLVLVMTRWHRDDLAGRLLDAEGDEWTVIRVPALAEANDPLGREPGDVLWPEKFSRAYLERLRDTDVDFDALYQQNPTARGGSTMSREWFANRFDASERALVNRCVGRWISWDTAMKDKAENDWTAYTVLELLEDYTLNTREVYRERITFPDLPPTIEDVATRYNRDNKLRGVIIEDKGSGTSAYQTLSNSGAPWLRDLLIPFEPPGSKEYRASLAAVWARLGCIRLPQPGAAAPWLAAFEDEFFNFPSVSHDDQVDSWVQAVLYLENFIAAGHDARQAHEDEWG